MSTCVRAHSSLAFAVSFLLLAAPMQAQVTTGPDVIVGGIYDSLDYGSFGPIAAFSIGTESCNVGTLPLNWFQSNNQHPVIAQSMYRLKDGRMTQIGMAWLKHGFAALNMTLCGSCQATPTTTLGVGCSDPYGASLNGTQNNLGPRSEVVADTGFFLYPWQNGGTAVTNIDKRLQVAHADLDPALNPAAQYFVEAHYVMPDDAAAGNGLNNASYRPIMVTPGSSVTAPPYGITLSGFTHQQQDALQAWQNADASVILDNVDVPGDGRFIVALKEVILPGPTNRFEYAIHNFNSDRSASGVSVSLPSIANVSNIGFHDVDYHSGEPFSGTNWTGSVVGNAVHWSTTDFATNPNANALRWGTTYNFWFESDVSPGPLTIEMFKPGVPATVTSTAVSLCPTPPAPRFVYDYSVSATAYDHVNILPVSITPFNLIGGMAETVPIGFDFPFYDITLTQIQISPSGYLSVPGELGVAPANTSLPDVQQPNGIIAAYWDDLDPSLNGVVRYATVGTAPNRRLVIEFWGVPHAANQAESESFQISLYESGRITTSWIATSQGGSGATFGVERPDGYSAAQLGYNTPGLISAGTSVEYNRVLLGATEADLALNGNLALGNVISLDLLSSPLRPFLLLGDAQRGPTWLSPMLAPLDIGFSPAFIPLLDGVGIFHAPDPMAVTDGCGVFSLPFTSPFPTGFDYTIQAIVVESVSPLLILRISNSYRIIL